MFGGNPFGWPEFGQAYAGTTTPVPPVVEQPSGMAGLTRPKPAARQRPVMFLVQPARVLVTATPARLSVQIDARPIQQPGVRIAAGAASLAISFTVHHGNIRISTSPEPDEITRTLKHDLDERIRETLVLLEL